MTLEDLIYKRLLNDAELVGKLTKYDNSPAVFYQYAPEDKLGEWDDEPQFPRIDYTVDMQSNPERHTSGVLTLNIWCSEISIAPEDVEPDVRRVLCDIFIHPEAQPVFCLAWSRSDAFDSKNGSDDDSLVIGISVLFDVYAFPIHVSCDPDPIFAMNEFLKEWNPNAIVIGRDSFENYLVPSSSSPVLYARLAELSLDRETNTVAWMRGAIACHVFSPPDINVALMKNLVDELSVKGEIEMLDASPMFLKKISADSSADILTRGQLRFEVSFGILRKFGVGNPLNHINTNIL